MTQALVREVQSLDKNLPVVEATTLRDYMRDILATERSSALLLGSLALMGMILAAVGLYAVVGYTVSQRTREIGIRMALGAHPADIMKLILGQGVRLAFWGAIAGLFVAFTVGKVMSSSLYGVRAGDPLTYAASVAVVLGTALLAAYVPARRTTKVDPTTVLRNE
jgi:ABC-type antimicrobial peptide transport system permease subunit